MIDGSSAAARVKPSSPLCSASDATQTTRLRGRRPGSQLGHRSWADPRKLLLYRFSKAVVWIYFKENLFAQPVAESRALHRYRQLWRAGRQSRVHTCSHGVSSLTGGLFSTLMYISPRVSSPQATGNAADYLIARYADGRLQFYYHFMM